jgi:IQ motif and SEC7 domain-containing protein
MKLSLRDAQGVRLFLDYPFCIRLTQKVDGKVLATFNARNEHDRCKFADDLRESIAEMDEMETIRIEIELERQSKATRCVGNGMNNNVENRDSGVVGDIEAIQFTSSKSFEAKSASNSDIQSGQLKRGGALSNSLLDIHDQCKFSHVHDLTLVNSTLKILIFFL